MRHVAGHISMGGAAVLCLGLLCLAHSGCAALLTVPTGDSSPLPTPHMSPDAAVLEVCVLYVSDPTVNLDTELWSRLDEQQLPGELRRKLELHGFRCGLTGMRLPPLVEKLLAEPDPLEAVAAAAQPAGPTLDEELSGGQGSQAGPRIGASIRPEKRRVQSIPGRRSEILSSSVRPVISLLENIDGSLRGRELRDAQCLLAMITQPQGDGRVLVELTPEVHFGQAKQKFVGHDGVFHMEMSRDRQTFDQLRMPLLLTPGQTLVLTATSEPRGVGRDFFFGAEGPLSGRKLLLIRLAQTQYDDLFAPERVAQPLVTSVGR